MISDVLRQSLTEIEDYEERMPSVYRSSEEMRNRLQKLKNEMHKCLLYPDTPPQETNND